MTTPFPARAGATSAPTTSPGPTPVARRANEFDATVDAGSSPDPIPFAPISFVTLVRVETRKLVDTRSGAWLLGIVALVTLGAIVLTLLTLPSEQLTFATLVGVAMVPQGILLPVVGALCVTSEWSTRSALSTYTLSPRRLRVTGAKLVAASLIGVRAVLLALSAAAAANAVGVLLRGGDGSWTLSSGVVGGIVLSQVIWIALGVAVGTLTTNAVAAVIVLLLGPAAWSAASTLVPALAPAVPWTDLAGATLTLTTGSTTGDSWGHLVSAFAVWVLVPLALGSWRLVRREVT